MTAEPGSSRLASRDTRRWAEDLMFARWRELTGEQKLKLVSEQCQALHRVSLAGLAARHPDASAEELELRAACLRVGRELAERLAGVRLRW